MYSLKNMVTIDMFCCLILISSSFTVVCGVKKTYDTSSDPCMMCNKVQCTLNYLKYAISSIHYCQSDVSVTMFTASTLEKVFERIK